MTTTLSTLSTLRAYRATFGPRALIAEAEAALKIAVCAVWTTAIVTALPLIAREYF